VVAAQVSSLSVPSFLQFSQTKNDGWSLTPSGWRPTVCTHGPIPEGHILVDVELFTYLREEATGKIVKTFPPCSENAGLPHPDTKPLPSGWAAYAWSFHAGGSLTSFNGSWTVPPVPSDQGSQTLFLFTGFQNAFNTPANVTNIIQPVLQWGSSAAGGAEYWAIASWYVDSLGNAFWSTLTKTQSGNTIQGNMWVNGAANSGTWTIQTIDATASKPTSLKIATNTTEPYAFVTLEVYTVSNCGEYPTGADTFGNFVFSPSFNPQWKTVATPGCEESVKVNSPTSVTVNF
jgi:hypothetical protein